MNRPDKGCFDSRSTEDYDRTDQSNSDKEKFPEDRSNCDHYLRDGIGVPRILPEKPNLNTDLVLKHMHQGRQKAAQSVVAFIRGGVLLSGLRLPLLLRGKGRR